MFDWIGDVGDVERGQPRCVPVVTGLFVGLALRWAAIAGEPSTHDAKADEMNSDLSRWVADRDRQLQAEIFRARNLAEQGIIEDVVEMPVPNEYRDDATLRVRAYRSMARREGWVHKLLRRGRRANREPSPFRLTHTAREILASWREGEVPSYYKPTATVTDDPTRAPDAAEILPLQTRAGLTWHEAGTASTSPE